MARIFAGVTRAGAVRLGGRRYEGKNSRRVGGGCEGLHDWGRLGASGGDMAMGLTVYL